VRDTERHESEQTLTGGQKLEGLLVPSRLPPYPTSPKMADYRAAMADYQPGEPLGGFGTGGFVVGKLLEKLAPVIGETGDQPGVDLDALHPPGRNARRGPPRNLVPPRPRPHQVNLCIVPTTVRGGTFVAHDPAETFVCAPNWKPE